MVIVRRSKINCAPSPLPMCRNVSTDSYGRRGSEGSIFPGYSDLGGNNGAPPSYNSVATRTARLFYALSRFCSSKGQVLSPLSGRFSSSKATNSVINKKLLFLAIGFFLLPWVPYYRVSNKLQSSLEAATSLKEQHVEANEKLNFENDRTKTLENSSIELERDNKRLIHDLRESGNMLVPDDSNYQELEKIEDRLLDRIDGLQRHIQDSSKNNVKKKYGAEGPYRVEVNLQRYDEKGKPIGREDDKIVIELAPLDLMPHAIDHFLQMVSKQLWDGLAFVHRDIHSHVMQATPLDVKTGKRALSRFEEAGLGKLSFSEYSPDYPHEAYTIGFAGRPGGPDFYINTVDNSVSHGPGEMFKGEVDEGESCFGKVVEGQRLLDSILFNDEKSGSIRVVGIKNIRVI